MKGKKALVEIKSATWQRVFAGVLFGGFSLLGTAAVVKAFLPQQGKELAVLGICQRARIGNSLEDLDFVDLAFRAESFIPMRCDKT